MSQCRRFRGRQYNYSIFEMILDLADENVSIGDDCASVFLILLVQLNWIPNLCPVRTQCICKGKERWVFRFIVVDLVALVQKYGFTCTMIPCVSRMKIRLTHGLYSGFDNMSQAVISLITFGNYNISDRSTILVNRHWDLPLFILSGLALHDGSHRGNWLFDLDQKYFKYTEYRLITIIQYQTTIHWFNNNKKWSTGCWNMACFTFFWSKWPWPWLMLREHDL